MDLGDSPAEATFRAEVREFIDEHGDHARSGGGREGYKKWRQALVDKGWIAPAWPKDVGGAGLGVTEQFVLNEEFAENGLSNFGGMGVMMFARPC